MIKTLYKNYKEEIEELHQILEASPTNTLREELAMGDWPLLRKKRLIEDEDNFKKIMKYMRDGHCGDFKQFGVYDRKDCGYMHKRSLYIPRIDADMPAILDKTSIPQNRLHELGMMMAGAPSALLPLKTFIIRWELCKVYEGPQPVTKPVRIASYFLLGEWQPCWTHTMLCNKLAKEVGTTPTHINTLFYLVGYTINGEMESAKKKGVAKALKRLGGEG